MLLNKELPLKEILINCLPLNIPLEEEEDKHLLRELNGLKKEKPEDQLLELTRKWKDYQALQREPPDKKPLPLKLFIQPPLLMLDILVENWLLLI